MTAKISNELLQIAQQSKPETEIPVLVKLNGPLNRAALEAEGLHIEHVFDVINTVSGTLRPAAVSALAQLAQVQLIEFDGEVRIAAS